jgi:hypothetical protein
MFGAEAETFTSDFRPQSLFESDRYRELDYREQFGRSTQHDAKMFDFQGRFIKPGNVALTQPLIGSSMPSFYVPLDQRRPSAPYRLPRLINQSFTDLLFGHGRFPSPRVPGDPDAQDCAEALAAAQELASVMTRARNLGGRVGTVGLSWRFWNGKPRTRVHNGKHLHVHEWADREQFEVAHASEIYQVAKDEWNARKRKVERIMYWHRRDWTPIADIAFVPVPVSDETPEWIIDEEETFFHEDGFAHFVWIPNAQEDDDSSGPDGRPDYDGQFEACNNLDVLSSVLNTGTIRNLDPTLVLAIDPDIAKRGVKKGSDNALVLGQGGTATYLELSGASATAGIGLRKEERKQILEVAQCVVPDPSEVAAAATSAAALRLVYGPMLSRGDVLRTQYGNGICRLLSQQLRSAQRLAPQVDEATGELAYPVELDGEGNETPVEYFLDLPPRAVEEEILDEAGMPTGEVETKLLPRKPGSSSTVRLEWGPYFPTTSSDQQAQSATLSSATGGKASMSQRTAVELQARSLGRDPATEWRRIAEEKRAAAEAEAAMFPGTGGEVGAAGELPPGAAPRAGLPPAAAAPDEVVSDGAPAVV